MRKILFRGKRVDGSHNWVYGSLIESKDKCFIIQNKNLIIGYNSTISSTSVQVIIPETVGQYTGVTDKNETKVFENDKVLVHENVCGEIKDWTAKVSFIACSFCLVNEDGHPICNLGDVCGTFEVIINE